MQYSRDKWGDMFKDPIQLIYFVLLLLAARLVWKAGNRFLSKKDDKKGDDNAE